MLRETLIGLGFKGIPKNHAAAIEITWCRFQQGEDDSESDEEDYKYHDVEIPRKDCIQHTYKKCGVGKFEKQLIADNIQLIRKLKNVKWKQWQKVKYKAPEGNKLNSKIDMVSCYGSSSCLVATYMKQLKSMSRHQFMKIWQLRNFNSAKENLQPLQLLCVHDFSQNILLFYQDEVGAKHWDHEQMSLHPSSLLMKCVMCKGFVHEEVIHLMPDKTHDHKAVEQFVQKTLHHLEEKGVNIKEIIEFTDHAASQYKSKFSFFNLSNMQIPTTRHYFGVKHGKGPSDCAGANYKKFVKKTILTGKNFDNCAELGEYSMMEYVEQRVTHGENKGKCDVYAHTLKSSFYHSQIFNHKQDQPKLRTLIGCRDQMHAVCNTGVVGVVEWRDFDCCCFGCMTHSSDCKYKNIADEWKLFSLTTHTRKELKQLDVNHWMPSFVQINQCDVERESKDEQELVSSDESTYDPGSEDSDSGKSSDDVRSLSPEEIIVSSDENDAQESLLNIPHPPDSDVSISSDKIEFLQETSLSESDGEHDEPLNYEKKLDKYHSYKHYTRLKGHIMRKRLPAPVTSIKERFTAADTVDPVACWFYPPDGPVGFFPIIIGSDGNCMPRALSHLFFGNEDHHYEVRIRIIEAAVLNEDELITHQNLAKGVTNRSKNRLRQYATYSPRLLLKHRRLNSDEIRDVYQAEIMGITKKSEYMGIWQLHQAAEAFHRPIASVFPFPANLKL